MHNTSLAAASLKSARLHFSEGRLDAARQLCRGILDAFPNQAGALHLLGLIAHQDGDRAAARDLLRQAAESPETAALYLLSYAELYCKPVDRLAALSLARRAVAVDGSLPLGWLYLGTLLMEMQQYPESRDCLERAAGLDPGLWQARTNLAIVLGRLGQPVEATEHFRQLLLLDAGNAQIIGNFAGFLQEQGRYADALAQAELAIAKRPDALEHQLRAADLEIQLQRPGAALARLNAAENIWPHEIGLVTLKAHALRMANRHGEAVRLCQEALARGIESRELLRAHGLALHLEGRDAEALAMFDRAAQAAPDLDEASANPEITGTHRARNPLLPAHSISDVHAALALSDKGVLLSQLGRLAEAHAAFDEALRHDPTAADAWYNKTNAKSFACGDPEIESMERLLEGQSHYRDRMLLHFALGKAHFEAGNEDRAFSHWHDGNRMKRDIIDYDADAALRRMAAAAARPLISCRPGEATGLRLSELPVFLVGMPRCGSSLLEQILASHPQIDGAGELLQLRDLFASADAPESNPREPGSHEPVSEHSIAEAAHARLRHFSPRAARVIDKDLKNFLHLGVIHRVFPHARIIHCRRNPLDTCFSAYSKLFLGDFGFTYNLRELGIHYRGYHALMAHWRRTLPGGVFMEIDYETLVSQPQAQTRRLLDFLGQPWDEACTRFFETRRRVNTASFAQVRRPIYHSSVGRGISLRPHLDPLIEALGHLVPLP